MYCNHPDWSVSAGRSIGFATAFSVAFTGLTCLTRHVTRTDSALQTFVVGCLAGLTGESTASGGVPPPCVGDVFLPFAFPLIPFVAFVAMLNNNNPQQQQQQQQQQQRQPGLEVFVLKVSLHPTRVSTTNPPTQHSLKGRSVFRSWRFTAPRTCWRLPTTCARARPGGPGGRRGGLPRPSLRWRWGGWPFSVAWRSFAWRLLAGRRRRCHASRAR